MIAFYHSKYIKSVLHILEILFLVLSGIYLLWQESAATMFQLPYPAWLDEVLFWSLFVIAVMRLILVGPLRKEFWLSLGLAVIYYLVYFSDGYRFLLYLAVLTVGYLNIDHRKILRTWLAVVGTIVCITAIAGMTGLISTMTFYYRNGVRSSLGFNYPTDFASIVLFVLLILWVAWKKIPDWLMLILAAGSTLLSAFIARSSTSLICSVLFFVCILCHLIDQKFLSRHLRLRWFNKLVNGFLTILFPLLLAVFCVMMFAYHKDMGIGIRLDSMMSSRISLAVDAVEQYGIHAFGTPFEMIGWGSTAFRSLEYNFVDSTYALILVRYGWVLLIAICLFWGWMVRKAIRCGNRKLALIMGIIALHSFSEHHFMDVHFNILLVMPFAAYLAESEEQVQETSKKKNIAAVITVVLCLIALFFVPRLLTHLKTIMQMNGLAGGGDNGWAVLGILFGLLIIIAFAVWAVYQILYRCMTHCSVGKIVVPVIVFLICSGVMAVSVIYAGRMIRQESQTIGIPESEQKALEQIASSAKGKVFSDLIPAVYQQRFERIDDSVLSGQDLVRFRSATIVTDADTEYTVFINRGFLFTQISEEHAVYTDDADVAEALMNAGYHLTGYYNYSREIDLKYEADLNSLEYSEEQGLLINGPDHPLFFGTGLSLHAGQYTVTFDLKLPDDAAYTSDPVCRLRASDSWGENVLQEETVSGSDFEADGTLSVSLPFSLDTDTFGIEFLAFPASGQSVAVKKISYCRTPDYDVHRVYDEQNRVIRESYYFPDGEQIVFPNGFASWEYGYDDRNYINRIRYYDTDGEVTDAIAGVAEIRWAYNDLDQIIRSECYTAEGEPLLWGNGAFACDYAYDQSGNLCWICFYDAENKPAIVTYGYAAIYLVYDAEHRIIREDFYDPEGNPCVQAAGYSSIIQAYDENGNLCLRRYLDPSGSIVCRTDGYAEVNWEYDEEGNLLHQYFTDLSGARIDDQDLNLGMDLTDSWSEWMTPWYGYPNNCFHMGSFRLGEKEIGDFYTCQVEIEFQGVTTEEGTAFGFWAQGKTDDEWEKLNIWNGYLVWLDSPPADGVYRYTYTIPITESNVDASVFNIDFRCDNWTGGSFRVNHIKIEKGDSESEWSPGL